MHVSVQLSYRRILRYLVLPPKAAEKHVTSSHVRFTLQIDESICTMYEYFDIFLGRMMMCRGAAEILGARFKLTANGSKVL